MKKNSFEISIIICIILFSLILFGGYLLYDLYLETKSYTMFLNPYTILSCKKYKCENVSDKLFEHNNKPYNIFIDGENLGLNDVFYNPGEKRFYVFNKNNDNIYDNGNLFAYSGKAKILQLSFKDEIINESEYSKLKSIINENFDVNDVVKISKDFDLDEEIENLYIINKEILEFSKISVLIYRDGDKYDILDNKKSKDLTEFGNGYVSNIIDIFNDGKLEFIYTIEYFDNIGRCNILYRLKGKKFVRANECEIVNE